MKCATRLLAAALLLAPVAAFAAQKPGKGDKLVDVELVTLDGQKTTLTKVINGRVAVFKFGATWCGWCTRQLAEFKKVAEKYPKDKVAVFDIDVGEGAEKVRRYGERLKLNFETYLDPKNAAVARYSVRGIPVTIVAAPDGTILYRGYYTPLFRLEPFIKEGLKALEASEKK